MVKIAKNSRSEKLQVKLKDIVFYVINLAEDIERRAFMVEQLDRLELQYEFVPGVKANPGFVGIALSHLKVLRKDELKYPFVILEDDCQFFDDRLPLEFSLPHGTDAFYLGHSLFGLREKDQYGLQWGKRNGTEYAIYDKDYIRIYAMLSRHAIMYISKKFHENALRANMKALLHYDFPHPGDMAYAQLQPDHLILSPHSPWCYQTEKHFGNHPATKHALVDSIDPISKEEKPE